MNDKDDPLPPQEFFKNFDIKEAWEDLKDEFRFGTAKTKATSTAKLIGKSLWNVGLHVVRNAPAHIEKAKESMEREAAAQEAKKLSFDKKSNSALVDIVKNGSIDSERKIAYDILRARKMAHEAQKNG